MFQLKMKLLPLAAVNLVNLVNLSKTIKLSKTIGNHFAEVQATSEQEFPLMHLYEKHSQCFVKGQL